MAHDFLKELQDYESGMGEGIAYDLLRGDADMYQKVQGLVITAQQTGNWYYGDLVMRVIWALLPEEARRSIGEEPGLVHTWE
jgi:hypothetical protein